MHRFSPQFSPPTPLITNIRAGSFSDTPEQGGGISIFYFFNPSNIWSSKHGMAALQIQAAQGTRLSVEQICMKFTNSKDYISVPTSIQILKEGIHRYMEFCDLIFGEGLYAVWKLSSWDSHISRYEHTYIDSQANDKNSPVKWCMRSCLVLLLLLLLLFKVNTIPTCL